MTIAEKLSELAPGATAVYRVQDQRVEVTKQDNTHYVWESRCVDAEVVTAALARQEAVYLGAYSPAR